jgi:hypothetical protein
LCQKGKGKEGQESKSLGNLRRIDWPQTSQGEEMSPLLKSFFIASAKSAVNALLTNTGLWLTMPDHFSFHNWKSFEHILLAAGSVILSREAVVWGPKLLAWSQSTNGGNNVPKS